MFILNIQSIVYHFLNFYAIRLIKMMMPLFYIWQFHVLEIGQLLHHLHASLFTNLLRLNNITLAIGSISIYDTFALMGGVLNPQ